MIQHTPHSVALKMTKPDLIKRLARAEAQAKELESAINGGKFVDTSAHPDLWEWDCLGCEGEFAYSEITWCEDGNCIDVDEPFCTAECWGEHVAIHTTEDDDENDEDDESYPF